MPRLPPGSISSHPGIGVNLASCVQGRRNGGTVHPLPPEGKRLVPAGGTISASCVCAAGTAEDFTLSLGERITRLPRREIEVAFSRYMWYNKSI